MSPRPLYQWKSFWFGLLTLAFMGWAFHGSFRVKSGAVLYAPASFYAVHAFEGRFYLVTGRTAAGTYEFEVMPHQELDSKSWASTLDMISRHGSQVSQCSFGMVFLPFLMAWIVWLGWRAGRLRALTGKWS